jgi:hypothetical protein
MPVTGVSGVASRFASKMLVGVIGPEPTYSLGDNVNGIAAKGRLLTAAFANQ